MNKAGKRIQVQEEDAYDEQEKYDKPVQIGFEYRRKMDESKKGQVTRTMHRKTKIGQKLRRIQ